MYVVSTGEATLYLAYVAASTYIVCLSSAPDQAESDSHGQPQQMSSTERPLWSTRADPYAYMLLISSVDTTHTLLHKYCKHCFLQYLHTMDERIF